MVELSDLPPEVLVILFEFLESSGITALSECCSKFSEIIENSERLTKKLTLYLKYPLDLTEFAESMINSNRRYRNLSIVKSRERCSDVGDPEIVNRVFEKLGATIKDLTIDWSNAMRPREASLFEIMNRRARAARAVGGGDPYNIVAAQALAHDREDIYNEFFGLIRHFTYTQKILLFNVHLEKGRQADEPELHYPNLRDLIVKQCDAFCFNIFSSCNRLDKLDVQDPWWNGRIGGIDTFEVFLVSQTSLKSLRLKNFQYPRLFQVDRTEQIIFKLESLVLNSVFFADKDIATSFFRTQIELQSIDFQLHNEKVRCLDESLWYNSILRTIISNSRLTEIKLEKLRYKIDDCGFISNIVNPHVKKLSFNVTSEDKSSDLFKNFIRVFPNLESIDYKVENQTEDTDSGICFDDCTVLDRVQSLVITNSSVRSLVNVHAGSLVNFVYVPGKTGEFIDDLFGGFFHRQ